MRRLIAGLICTSVLGIVIILFTSLDSSVLSNEKHPSVNAEEKKLPSIVDKEIIHNTSTVDTQLETTPSHDTIVELTTQFMNLIVQDLYEDYQVVHYDSKDELLEEFEKIASKEVAKPFVDFYFKEKNGNLYIVPTETPAWFVKDKDYDMKQIEDGQVKINQFNESEFFGDYTIELTFTYTNKGWKITNITYPN
ncbi:hypothetical protein [Ornithinibacillus halophilus]|uniref:DUF3993 domain-containing protein n=1 Tax=Ornithinibacillus halophilus TaxID=930117 RepID=A0A1M5K7L7_9BACI|nr:hypothetical protein [Ornithinibacillus halophilus]SHG48822.1 hypothetical protein SAMN05216225_103622 [Ornithinibacillus halophilus]